MKMEHSCSPTHPALITVFLLNDLAQRCFAFSRMAEVVLQAEKIVQGLQQKLDFSKQLFIGVHEAVHPPLRGSSPHLGSVGDLYHVNARLTAVEERKRISSGVTLAWIGLAARCAIVTGLRTLGVELPSDCIIIDIIDTKEDYQNEIMSPAVAERYFFGQHNLFLRFLDHAVLSHLFLKLEDHSTLEHIFNRKHTIAFVQIQTDSLVLRRHIWGFLV